MDPSGTVSIRRFDPGDRKDVRRISCATALLGEPLTRCFDEDGTLADALTLYFTDYEPGSCFVALDDGGVIGYVIGAKNVGAMRRTFGLKVVPRLVMGAARRRVFLRRKSLLFILHSLMGLLRGEFSTSRFSDEYPATLHINVDIRGRRRNVGSALLQHYVEFLRNEGVAGVHVSTMSETASRFFKKNGFKVLAEGRRTFLTYCLGSDLPSFVLGRKL